MLYITVAKELEQGKKLYRKTLKKADNYQEKQIK